MECLLPYLCMVTVPHIMVRLERMLDYRGFTVHEWCDIRTSHLYCVHNEPRSGLISVHTS